MKISGPDMPLPGTGLVNETNRAVPGKGKEASAAERHAAQEFEAIFLRKMLASMDKSSQMGGSKQASGAADGYSSMVVGALADAVAAAGGIGLRDSLLRSIEGSASSPTSKTTPPASPKATDPRLSEPSIQGFPAATVQPLGKGSNEP